MRTALRKTFVQFHQIGFRTRQKNSYKEKMFPLTEAAVQAINALRELADVTLSTIGEEAAIRAKVVCSLLV